MTILRTVATFALGFAAARSIDRLRKKPGVDRKEDVQAKAEAAMKARANRFRDQHTTPKDGSAGQ